MSKNHALFEDGDFVRTVFQTVGALIVVLDPKGQVVYFNPACERATGFEASEVVGRQIWDILIPENLRDMTKEVFDHLAAGNFPNSHENPWLTKTGELRHISWSNTVMLNDVGEVTYVIGTGVDITDTVRTMKDLQLSEKQFRDILSHMTDIYHRTDANGIVEMISRSAEDIVGYSAEEIIGTQMADYYFEPADRETFIRALQEGDGEVVGHETQLRHRDGHGVWMSSSARLLKDEEGNVTGVEAISRNVDTLREQREQLSNALTRFQELADNINEVFWIGSPDWQHVYYISPAYEEVWGRTCQSLYDDPQSWIESVHPDDLELVMEDVEKRVSGALENPILPEYRVIRPDGEVRWIKAQVFPIRDEEGTVLRVVGRAEDATNLKTTQQELIEAKEHAEQANAAKSKFLAAASHDLRQPLQAMRLFIYALDQSMTKPTQDRGIGPRELLRRLEDSVDILGGLLNALLDISKLEAGVVEPTLSDVSMDRLMSNARARFGIEAQDKDVELRILNSTLQVHTDPALLGSIIDNLLSNAIRYTVHGKVLVGVRRCGNMARLEVWDTGVGISESKLAEVFEEFVQLSNPARQRSKGLGLGLSIVRRLSDLLGLELDVKSELGKGSVFSVTIPLAETAQQDVRENMESGHGVEPGEPKTVMIIEDDQLVLHATAGLINSWGHEVILATSAPNAMDKVNKLSSAPDLVVIDYRLPGNWTGLDAYRAINAHFGGEVPGIIISGDTSPGLLQEFKDSGLPFLTKPIDPRALERCLPVLFK